MNWRTAFLLLTAFALSVSAAGLEWESTRFEALAHAEDSKLETVFRFKNTSNRPVAIAQITPSCGCTAAKLDKQVYAAGEEGTLLVTYDFEGRTGRQEKTIQVLTADDKKPTSLVLAVTIAESFTITPRILVWGVGEKPDQKAVRLTSNRDLPLKPIEVKCDNPQFEVRLVPLEMEKRYELQVLPRSQPRASKSTVSIIVENPQGLRKTHVVYLVVQ